MLDIRCVDYAQKQRILNYSCTEEDGKSIRKGARKKRPVSVVTNEFNTFDLNLCSEAPSDPFLSASNNNNENDEVEDPGRPSLVDWISYPDEAISPLISYFATSDVRCLEDTVCGSTALLTLKASHELNSFECQIILTKAIYSMLKEETLDTVLQSLIFARENCLNHLLTLLDCVVCDSFAIVNFRPHLRDLTIGDLCTWLRTSSHLKISALDHLRNANDEGACFSIYECGEAPIYKLVANWLRHDPKTRIEHLPKLLPLVSWHSFARPLDVMMTMEEVRDCKWARTLVKRVISAEAIKNKRPRCNRPTVSLLGPDLFKPKYLRDVLSKLDEEDRERSNFLSKNQKMIRLFFDNPEQRPSCMYIGLPVDVRLRSLTRSVVYEDDLVFVSPNAQLSVYRYETATGSVTILPPPRISRLGNFSVTVVDGKLLLLGGRDKDGNAVLDIELLDLTRRHTGLKWTKISRIPLLKTWWKQTCCNYRGRLFCWFLSPTGLNTTYLFDFDTQEWTPAISNWQTSMVEMTALDDEADVQSIAYDRYVVSLFGRTLYALDLAHNDMIRTQLPQISERDVPFEGGFYRYNVQDTCSINTLLLIHPAQTPLIERHLAKKDTCCTLFKNNLSCLEIADSVPIPYLPETCIVSALKIGINRDMYEKLGTVRRRSTLWDRMKQTAARCIIPRT